MKILQIFAGKIWGGAEQYVLDLGEALAARGHEVRYAARDSRAVLNRIEGRIPCDVIRLGRGLAGLFTARSLAQLLRETKPDVVHLHDTAFVPAVMLARRLSGSRARIVLTRHIARRSRTPLIWRGAFRQLHRLVFVSDLASRMWCGANGWMPAERCRTVLNSIPEAENAPSDGSLRTLYGIPASVPLLLFTGRVRRSKGCATIVRALGLLRDKPFFMLFVGACKPTGYDDTLLRKAEALGIGDRVRCHGFSDRARQFVGEADLGLAPSIVRESCGLSPMEFMQAGKCVIATDNGAQSEYLRSGVEGLLVPPDDAEALAAAIGRCLDDDALRHRLGKAAGERFERELTYDRFVDRILSAYE